MSKPFEAIEEIDTEESARRRAIVESKWRQIVVTAQRMLDGELSFIEGARALLKFRSSGYIEIADPDILPFVLIESETDALPLGDVRALWKPESLVRLQPEIEHAEQWARELGSASCRNLIKRFS
jgi:hypothetical protein